MNDTNDLALQFETLAKLRPEPASRGDGNRPGLGQTLRAVAPLPRGALFLGVAEDGLPVLLNLEDPVPGPLLVAGDSGSGKTLLLRMVAEAIAATYDADSVRFAVLADTASEWENASTAPNCEGILAFQQPLTANYVGSLVHWAHTNQRGRDYVVLLIDGLESLQADPSLHQWIRWLLLRGPARRIWPIVTVKATRAASVADWLPSFRTRLCGHIAPDRDLALITGPTDAHFDGLQKGSQFAMREGRGWLPFWLPAVD
ncbi:MAG TPA: NACHT domain-containing protein [Anaerolineales bacterium]|nr:NACHT domain-containing protein [Anaerolineales bacterium]